MTKFHPGWGFTTSLYTSVYHAPAVPLIAAAASAATAAAVGSSLSVFAFGAFYTGLSGATFSALAAGVSGFVVSTAINQIGTRALSKQPKAAQFTGEASGRTVMIRSSVESHKIIYGQSRVSGPLVYVTTKDSGTDKTGSTQTGKNKFLHMVLPLAGHEVEEIGDIYLNDKIAPLDGNGWATSAPYVGTVERETSIVTQVLTAATTNSVAAGDRLISTLTVTTAAPHGLQNNQTTTLNGTSDSRLDGTYVIDNVLSATQFVARANLPNLSATGGSVTRRALTTQQVSFVRVKKHLGAESQTADADLIAECGLTSDFRLRGIAYLYVRMEYSPDAFPLGIPNVSAVVKGKKVYDPRTATTAWSPNAALCIRDFMASSYGFNCQSDEIDDTYFIAAANASDEDVPLRAGGTQDRYTCNGVLDTAVAPLDNLTSLLSSVAGAVTYVQGKFRLHAGVYDTPSGDIDTTILAGPVKVRARTPRKELFNAVKGTYLDPNKNWQPTDFPFVINSVYEAQDGGQRIYKDIELPFTNHPEAAQRIGKVILEKARQGIIVELTVFHEALKYSVFDVVTLTNPQLGWNAKPFRILKWSVSAGGDKFSPIGLVLQEESAASYDWNNGEASTGDSAPDTDLPDPFTVEPPGALTITESTYVTRSGDGVKALAMMRWVASDDALLRDYLPEYKPRSEEVWTRLPATNAIETVIEDIAPDLYDFRVKSRNTLGVSSAYSTASRQISGLLAPPLEPQNLTISTIGGLAVLRWDLSTDLDVRIGGRIEFRHSPNEADGWTQSTSIGQAQAGTQTVAVLPLKPGVYLAKCRDSSGVESTAAASVVTSQATALEFANVTSLTEHPTFTGDKTNCYVDDLNRLRLSGIGLFSDIPLLSEVASVAGYGGLSPSGTYATSGGIDLGVVKRVRLTAHVRATVINQLDRISNRTGNVSTWTSFSGTTAADADAVCYVRTTNDDPSGSPVWKDWQRLDQAEFEARAFDPELRLSSQDPAYNIAVSEFTINVDEVV